MSMKYCESCSSPTEMTEFDCRSCGGSSFTHTKPEHDYCSCGKPLIEDTNCSRCKKAISPARLRLLAGTETGTKKVSNNTAGQKTSDSGSSPDFSTEPKPVQPHYASSSQSATMDDLVRAQNRTTHAVRAFVRFLFIQLSGVTLAVFVWNLSSEFIDERECLNYGENCTPNSGLQFLAAVIWVSAVVWSSRAGWEELEKSRIS